MDENEVEQSDTGCRKGVLIVENDQSVITRLTRELASVNIENILVLSTREEVKNFLQGKDGFRDRAIFPLPRVLFVDATLPDGDALEGLSAWRKILGNQTLIVLMTDILPTHDLGKLYRQGADTFLSKPVSQADINHLIKFHQKLFFAASDTVSI